MKVLMIFLSIFLLSCATAPKGGGETVQLFKQAEDYYQKGLLSEAEASYLKLSKLSPNVSEVWMKLGNIYVRTGYLDASVRMYEKCIDIDQKETRCWNNLALARIKQAMKVLETGTSQVDIKDDQYEQLNMLYEKLAKVISVKES
ncbi:MAG: hypothetical protein AAGC78_02315 [Cellvibrio sp.]|uniref:tetratricopeptide repeat protein n=1 Tax=Cellvibrio sp. TaxID=1965322 RepID=UPI0031B37547